MNKNRKIVFAVCISMAFLISVLNAQDPDEMRNAYQEAKMAGLNQNWTLAIAMFDEFQERYPDSKYEDDVLFWTGYAHQQLPGHAQESFNTYSRLVNNHPNSTWADDALRHQVTLAEQFILEGNDVYKEFLYNQLGKEDKDIQFRSAIALGKIGDKKALPVLEKMKNDKDYASLADELIVALKTDRLPIDDEARKLDDKKKMDLIYEKDKIKSEEDKPTGFLVFDTDRYAQYRKMLRTDNDWSEEELTTFALWHILELEDFEEYSSLATEDDKFEWRRKYWKRKDPTPTTDQNEIEEEFQRRIDHSRAYFSEFWNNQSFKYLPDQHMRLGWPHAPWDARGELYIKYGEPDFRSAAGFHQELWTYNRYSVDFLVKQYMTNIFGNAIAAGELSYRLYDNIGGPKNSFDHLNPLSSARQLNESLWNTINSFVMTNFIFNQEIRYIHDYNANLIEDIKLFYNRADGKGKSNIVFRYQLPVEEFELISQPTGLEVRYKEVYCVLDEDLREVVKQEMVRKIGNIPDDDHKLEESILLNLPEGKYTLHLRIEDQNAENLGIFSYDFEVKNL
jgi:hypothetical protein